jgi:hypothetical protein
MIWLVAAACAPSVDSSMWDAGIDEAAHGLNGPQQTPD